MPLFGIRSCEQGQLVAGYIEIRRVAPTWDRWRPYAIGAFVIYKGATWRALASSIASKPDESPTKWIEDSGRVVPSSLRLVVIMPDETTSTCIADDGGILKSVAGADGLFTLELDTRPSAGKWRGELQAVGSGQAALAWDLDVRPANAALI